MQIDSSEPAPMTITLQVGASADSCGDTSQWILLPGPAALSSQVGKNLDYLVGAAQLKLAASLSSPLPLYFAISG